MQKMKYEVSYNTSIDTPRVAYVQDKQFGVCSVFGSDCVKVAKRIANALHLLDTVETDNESQINQLITELKSKK